MIQSMTGYAAAQHVDDGVCYSVEIRSLNNRYLKLSVKLPEHLQFVESDIDKLVRSRITRGSVTYTLRVRSEGAVGLPPLNLAALRHYVEQLSKMEVKGASDVKRSIDLATLATLPGVCDTLSLSDRAGQHQRDLLTDLTSRVLDHLIDMRRVEGKVLRQDLRRSCEAIQTRLRDIEVRAPHVVEEYHQRLQSRVETLMKAGGFELEAQGLMREVAIYAERCDISEEIARLHSHLDQFEQLCESGDRVGRTLEFLNQELLREANTIASKSNDTAIARSVVEVKGLIDRLREQAQNVE